MLLYLLLLFTVAPLCEFIVLYWIGERIGLMGTLALVLGTGVVGASLARWQGVRTLWQIQDQLREGRMPTEALMDGLMILIAGAVLITPGVLTDALGFALLAPPTRAILKRGLRRWIARNVQVQSNLPPSFWEADSRSSRDQVIDAEVIETRVDPK